MNDPKWKRGDRVMWQHAIGPDTFELLPGIVHGVTQYRRIRVEVLHINNGESVRIMHSVSPKGLALRTQLYPELDG